MSKNNDIKTALPKLRFPEFKNDKEWDIMPIQKACEILNNKRKAITSTNRKRGIYPYYGASGICDYIDNYIFSQPLLLVGEDGAKWGAYEDSAFIAKGKYWVNNHAHVLNPIKIDIVILKNYLVMLDMTSYITGAAPPKLTLGKLKDIPIPIASCCLEQKKIAECLSSLDDVISGVSDKIEALKEYKKGLMQQLFPTEGKTTPAFRFPEFQNSGEWIETTLGAELNYENGKAHENGIVIDGHYVVVNSKFISTDGAVRKYTNEPFCIAKERDILMVLSDVPNGRAIAKCFFVDESDKYTVNQRVCKLTTKGVDSKFLYYILNRNGYFLSFDDGVKQTNLKKDDVLKCPLNIPTDPDEQKKIAATLSSLDNLISSSIDRQEQLKAHKNGLMQQLFPNLNE